MPHPYAQHVMQQAEPGDLRQAYLLQLKDHRPAIADWIARCERSQLAAEDRAGLLRRAHWLSCSSAAAGYSAIGRLALALEDALIRLEADKCLLPLAMKLHQACHEALVLLPSQESASVQQPLPQLSRMPLLLTADDDRTVRMLIHSMFDGKACVLSVEDGHSALVAISVLKPDLVLLDDTMPGMTGMRLIETLRSDDHLCDTNVIMLTSSDRPKDIERALDAGAMDYILKPFDPARLKQTVWAALQQIVH